MIKVDSFSFQGVNGAYSEQAGKNIFPNATSIPCATFEDMFEHVRSGKSEAAMVPIENSLAGRVADTQRLIPDSNLKITYEYFHEVNHNLLGIRGAKISDIKRIRSHEQGIAQCRNKILKLDKQMIVEADTAGSAKLISELNNIEDGAIASELAANIYDLDILEKNFQDTQNNVTRFLVMQKNLLDINPDTKDILTTLVFTVRSIPAVLYKCLGGFATNQVNLTKLESFSVKNTFDQTNFYLDLQGHIEERNVQKAMEELGFHTQNLDILGVYEASNFRGK